MSGTERTPERPTTPIGIVGPSSPVTSDDAWLSMGPKPPVQDYVYTNHPTKIKRKLSTAVASLLWGILLASLPTRGDAVTYDVSPDGDMDASPYSLTSALQKAGAGDTISLADGTYKEPLITTAGGEEGKPLRIVGTRAAEINGHDDDKVVLVQHSWVSLEGFTVNGRVDDADESSSFAEKCVYVQGQGDATTITYADMEVKTALMGFSMNDMAIKNCGGECVRLRDFVTHAQLTNNDVRDCGVHAYVYDTGGKNGEAFYIGTSSKQWTDGEDGCTNNVISGNTIIPNGNECVDIKEGSTGNIIEYNDCTSQLDESSGCFGSRGDGNTFRYNAAYECLGAGVRLGGWEMDGHEYGQDNNVYGNMFADTGTGVLSVKVTPQGQICDNGCSDGACGVVGTGVSDVAASWDQPCEENTDDLIAIPFTSSDGDDVPTSPPTTPSPIPGDVSPPSPGASETPSPTETLVQPETDAPVTLETPIPVTAVPSNPLPVTPSPSTPAPVPTPVPATTSPVTPFTASPILVTAAPSETPGPVTTASPETPTPMTLTPSTGTTAPIMEKEAGVPSSMESSSTTTMTGVLEPTEIPVTRSSSSTPSPTAVLAVTETYAPDEHGETPAPAAIGLDAPTGSPVDNDIVSGTQTPMTGATSDTSGESRDTPSPVTSKEGKSVEPTSMPANGDVDDVLVTPSPTKFEIGAPMTVPPVGVYTGAPSTPGDENGGATGACNAIEMSAAYVTATTGTQDGHPASHAIDGDPMTRWSAEGAGAWLSIELPEAEEVSGLTISFEDGDERVQSFVIVAIDTSEVLVEVEASTGRSEGPQYFAFEEPSIYMRSIMLVGYGNTINDWNSITEVALCKQDISSSRNLAERDNAPVSTNARRSLRGARRE